MASTLSNKRECRSCTAMWPHFASGSCPQIHQDIWSLSSFLKRTFHVGRMAGGGCKERSKLWTPELIPCDKQAVQSKTIKYFYRLKQRIGDIFASIIPYFLNRVWYELRRPTGFMSAERPMVHILKSNEYRRKVVRVLCSLSGCFLFLLRLIVKQ